MSDDEQSTEEKPPSARESRKEPCQPPASSPVAERERSASDDRGSPPSPEPSEERTGEPAGDRAATEVQETAPSVSEAGERERSSRERLTAGLWPPRVTRVQLIMAVLLLGLGLGLTIQVRSTSEHSVLRGARQEDLVRILSELDDRTARLEDEKKSLENQRTELETSSDQAEEARRQTERKERQLGVLAGTVAAVGPGITLTVTTSTGTVEADMLLDSVQELRAAGAEAIQINDVRVVAGTYFSQADGVVRIDGHRLAQPYRLKAIGDPDDLEPALNIPGGVVQTFQKERATVSVSHWDEVTVDALRSAKRPDYARSSSQ